MKTRLYAAMTVVAPWLWLTGCTFPSSTRTLPPGQVGQMQKISVATITKVHDVVIEGNRSNMGQYGGAVVGGAAAVPGGGIGGRGDALPVAGASVAGAIVGQAVEEYVTRKQAQEITIQMSNGDMFVIVQESPPRFQVGDKVRVIHGPNGARLEMALEF